ILEVFLSCPAIAAAAGTDVAGLVAEAARPEVVFAEPARADSLVGVIAADPQGSLPELLGLIETPWALQFDIVRRCLERIGESARLAVVNELEAGPAPRRAALLLVVFEKTGGPGYESLLSRYTASGEPSLTITALRVLAAFGEPAQSAEIATPLLTHPSPQVRLAAAWALGEICRREKTFSLPEKAVAGLNSLLKDSEPRVRLTAAETLAAAEERAK
ncbi:MAG TPA: HEAT repeat domain-containing protein, partial [Candidatus Glassbacteria bacterium]|nr:HEAT repeat domain-containing protein [Candidatus Glassbacteria bacterium]